MHCETFKSQLNNVLDERLNPQTDSSLRAHALRCGECAELLDMHGELLSTVRQLPAVAPRADFAFRVMAAFEADSAARKSVDPTTRRWSSRWLTGILAVAAALGFVVVSWDGSNPKPGDLARPQVVGQSPREVAVISAPLSVSHSAADLEQHREWVAGLAQGIKPVTSSVYTALQTIWRTLPASELAQVIL
jgi:anti-sigma factor RsiW